MSTGKILLGTIAGIAVGTTLGVLFAPEKGEVTRKKIKDKGMDYADGLKTKYSDLKNAVTEQFENVKEDVTAMADQVKSKYEDAVKGDVKKDINTFS